jgi:hypothetical protein
MIAVANKAVQFAIGDRLLISRKHLSIPADRDVPWKLRALHHGDYPVIKVLSRPDVRLRIRLVTVNKYILLIFYP